MTEDEVQTKRTHIIDSYDNSFDNVKMHITIYNKH